jgi:YidC/Oxa1 family membrane protein insertase
MNLGQPDQLFILPLVVFATTFLQQKLLMPSRKKEEDKQGKKKEEEENPMASMTQSMQVTMPVMFGFMALSFPAGLSLYFILSNIIGIGQGLLVRRSMPTPPAGAEKAQPVPSSADVAVAKSANGREAAMDVTAGTGTTEGAAAKKKKQGSKKKRRR